MIHSLHRQEYIEILLFFMVLLGIGIPVGKVLGRVLQGDIPRGLNFLQKIETGARRMIGAPATNVEMSWREYLWSVLLFSLVSFIGLVVLLKSQSWHPFNPQAVTALSWPLAINTAVSFITNTNWQAYSGESTLSYASQMLGLGVQNFVSPAVGIAVMAALARGLVSQQVDRVGNFWTDLIRITLYVLVPLCFILAVLLIGQGVVQNFSQYKDVLTLEGLQQLIPGGPAASQIAIKQLGTNGGGFFGVNSTHPFENPTPLSNFLEVVSIILMPLACVVAFGELTKKRAHAKALLCTMFAVFVPILVFALWAESGVNTALNGLPFFEGKETRIGIGASTLWEVVTTTVSNGGVNAMHDSFSALAGLTGMFNIMLGEVIFGGAGSGLYGLILFVIIAVFLAGLMVGRSPEYFGKKIESREVAWAAFGVLAPSVMILVGSTIAFLSPEAMSARSNFGPHGLSEVLYAFVSASGNNGSAFAGLSADTTFYNLSLSACMLVGRFAPIFAVLKITGSLSMKKATPGSLGTFPTHGVSFVLLLAGVVIIVGALTFLPVLALGPIAEHFLMLQGITF